MRKEEKKQQSKSQETEEEILQEPKVDKKEKAGVTQVIEIPESAGWMASSDLGIKVDNLRTKYVLKSITITFGKNVVIEIFK
jgi:hypothetical protein